MQRDTTSDLENQLVVSSNRSRLPFYALVTVPCAAAFYVLSNPVFSYLAREFCYYRWGHPKFLDNPLDSIKALVSCEYSGAYAFRWQESLEWISSHTKPIMGMVTSFVGSMAVFTKCFKRKQRSTEREVVLPTSNQDVVVNGLPDEMAAESRERLLECQKLLRALFLKIELIEKSQFKLDPSPLLPHSTNNDIINGQCVVQIGRPVASAYSYSSNALPYVVGLPNDCANKDEKLALRV